MSKLTPAFVKQVSEPGSYQDGRGLFLKVGSDGAKRWVFRFQLNGRRRDMGIGAFPAVSLRDARLSADQQRLQISKGIDPLEERDKQREDDQAKRRRATLFRAAAEAYIKTHRESWSEKHASQWANSLASHVYPVLGAFPVADIDTDDVLDVLLPIWSKIPTSANRIRNRIELILDAAKAKKQRHGENPARWRGHLDKLLPKQRRDSRPFPAMPTPELPGFLRGLDSLDSLAARACELLIYTAGRSSEVCGARWSEFDFDAQVWTIPAERMKAGRAHRIPLTRAALDTLDQRRGRHPEWVFPNARGSGPIPGNSITRVMAELDAGPYVPHGFRSTFRTWAAEHTEFPREVCEMALAHTLDSKVEAAYNRGDLLGKRRLLMETWAEIICSDPVFERWQDGKISAGPAASDQAMGSTNL